MTDTGGGAGRSLAVVINPTKFDDVEAAKSEVEEFVRASGGEPPRWYETSEDDPGRGQAQQAVDDGADVVASFGGDGTVRAVASVLVGGETPLALLPGGTGNLLARNLGLPVDDIEAAVRVAVQGNRRRIDTGVVQFGSHEGDQAEERFLVMVGMGLDADTMAGTPETLKARIGWPAYVLGGVKELVKAGFRACVDSPGEVSLIQHARSVLVGNCGTLTGGVVLMPDAEVDDATLDAVVVSPFGLVGWTALIGDVVTRSRHGHRMMARRRASEFWVRLNESVQAEVDGDPVGRFERMHVRCDPASLTVIVDQS